MIFTVFNNVLAQDIILVNDETKEGYLAGNHVLLFIDSSAKMSLNQVILKDRFIQPSSFIEKNKVKKANYWFKSKLHFSQTKTDFLLEIPDHRIDQFDIYILKEGKILKSFDGGDKRVFNERNYNHKNFEFRLPPIEGEVTIYFKAHSAHLTFPFLIIRSLDRFINYSLQEYLTLGLFYGMLLIMIIFNLFLFISTKERSRLFYVLYVSAALGFMSSLDGLGFQILWYRFPAINNYTSAGFLCLMSIFNLLYTYQYLHRKLNKDLLKKIISYLIIIRTTIFLCAVFLFPYLREWIFIDILIFATSLYLGIRAYKKGFHSVKIYLIGFSFLLSGFIIHILKYYDLFPNNAITVYSTNAGLLLEIIFLAVAISNQYRDELREKEKAITKSLEESRMKEHFRETLILQLKEKEKIQARVNNELEEKVNEKTKELIEKNKEIDRINSLLDQHNFNLQKTIKGIQAEIITGKAPENVDFKIVFDNEFKCLKYLEKLKWGEDINPSCKYCHSTEMTEGPKNFPGDASVAKR